MGNDGNQNGSPRLAAWIGFAVCLGSILWCIAAPMLAASKMFSVWLEIGSYGKALLASLFGAILLIFFGRGAFPMALSWMVTILSVVTPIALGFLMFSNDIFLSFTARRLSASEWESVVAAIERLDKGTGPYSETIEDRSIPSILDNALGLRRDFNGARMSKGDEKGASFQAFFSYGPKSRRWGVVLGEPIPRHLKRVRTVSVHPRLTLYVGVD